MKKKGIIIGCAAAAAVLAAVLFCALVPCFHGLTAFQTADVKSFMKSNPFYAVKEEDRAMLPVAAAVGTNGYDTNTFVGSRIQMETQPDYIEVNLAVDADGRLVLADSYFEAGKDSIEARRVAESLLKTTGHTSLLVNLAEYTSLNTVAALVTASDRLSNAVIRGVDENTISYVRSYFPSHTVLCEYSHRNKLSLQEIKAQGADGIYCSASMLSAHFAKKVHDAGLVLWVNCKDSAYSIIKTTSMAGYVDGLVTEDPALALAMQRSWSYERFKQIAEQ